MNKATLAPAYALITGAASGLGLSLARFLFKQGITPILVDVHEHNLKLAANELNAPYFLCDVTDSKAVFELKSYCEHHQWYIRWLFNNAGISHEMKPLWQLPPEVIHRVMNVNFYGAIHIIQAFVPYLSLQEQRSHIVNIASMYGLISGSNISAYAMSKHALLALSESLYYDLRQHQLPIDVSIAFPSFINTGLLSNQPVMNRLMRMGRDPEDVALKIVEMAMKGQFYIFPDMEVKNYLQDWINHIGKQDTPVMHDMERLMVQLIKKFNLSV